MARQQDNRKRVLTNTALEAAIFSHLLRGRFASDLLPLIGPDPEVFSYEPFCAGYERLQHLLVREGRMELAQSCFDFLPTRAALDLAGWPEVDIFAHS